MLKYAMSRPDTRAMTFPARRLRRYRKTEKMRSLIRQTSLTPTDLICPMFVQEDISERVTIESMPGMQRIPLSDASGEAGSISDMGIPAVMLFGVPATKDDAGSSAFDRNGIVQRAASQIRQTLGDRIVIMADVCMCQYTSSGHCGITSHGAAGGADRATSGAAHGDGAVIDNDASLGILARIAVSQAESGVDVVSPSAMMDGQVASIRSALDESGFAGTMIMPHSAKQRSGFYSPFRDAAECAPRFGDRATYQAPYTNARESMLEMEADASEGADIIMVKPAIAYLDLIAEARRRFDLPVAAYSVSGEYALVKAAAAAGYVDGAQIALEMLYSIRRAGADMIVTYFAKEIAGSIAGT